MLAELSVRGLRHLGFVAILLSLIFAACGSDQGADQTTAISKRAAFTRKALEDAALRPIAKSSVSTVSTPEARIRGGSSRPARRWMKLPKKS